MSDLDLPAIRGRAAFVRESRRSARLLVYGTAVFGAATLDGPELEDDVDALIGEVLRQRELIERLRPMGTK